MFGQLFSARCKAAERALQDGRLDEAFRLANAPDLRANRRAAAVLAALGEKFLARAREHYRADRCEEALGDLDKAGQAGAPRDQFAELNAQVLAVATELRRQERTKRSRLEAAIRRAEAGSLDAGRRILENVGDNDRGAAELRKMMDDRTVEVRSLAVEVERLLREGQFAQAAKRIRRARNIDAHDPAINKLEMELSEKVLTAARSALIRGRLKMAREELSIAGELSIAQGVGRELHDILTLAKSAANDVQNGDYADARRHLMSLLRLLPEATWIGDCVSQLKQIDDLQTSVLAGPLGERIVVPASPKSPATRTASLDDTIVLAGRQALIAGSSEPLLLLIDGGGSHLILRGGRATVGRAATENPADVALFGDIAERHATISRAEDDYFLFATREVEVGGQPTTHHLLRDGDRMVLGRKAKLTFGMPNRLSPTAVLDLSDTTKMPKDVRRVILFHQQATLGNGSSAHIRCRHAGASMVLFERQGSLWVRQRNDGHVNHDASELFLGEPVEIGGLRMTLQPWRTPGKIVS